MYGKWKMLGVVLSTASVLLVATTIMASSWTQNTPLYAFRMQQMSSEMNFLPTAVSGFVYTAYGGCILNCDALGEHCSTGYGGVPADESVEEACQGPETLNGGETCSYTICSTCENTCITCAGQETCDGGPTCELTCPRTCLTCYETCRITCFYPCPATTDTCDPTCNTPCPPTQGYC